MSKLTPRARSHSWALDIDMQYPRELAKLSRLSYYGTGIGKGLQEPEWDFKSTVDQQTQGRLFLQKSPRDVYNIELKRDMVANDRKLKSKMKVHRENMHRESQSLERAMRKSERPYVCYRGNIKSKFGDKFNELPASLNAHKGSDSLQSSTRGNAAPLTVEDAGTVLSEQYVVCHRCQKTYKESHNSESACRYHLGPILAVFGGMCQYCGMLDYTEGCVLGFHARRKTSIKPGKASSSKRKKQ